MTDTREREIAEKILREIDSDWLFENKIGRIETALAAYGREQRAGIVTHLRAVARHAGSDEERDTWLAAASSIEAHEDTPTPPDGESGEATQAEPAWSQDRIDDEMLDHDLADDGDEPGDECGRWSDGRLSRQCSKAGTEECDFECPYRDGLYGDKADV